MRRLLVSVALAAAFFQASAARVGALAQADVKGGRGASAVGDGRWTAEMGWRYVSYTEGGASLSLQIEPMVKGGDLVYVPTEGGWSRTAPDWARRRRAEILSRLKSVGWNRKLEWPEGDRSRVGTSPLRPVPGSLESTPGGRALEEMRLFDPGGDIPHERAHELWHEAARAFVKQARGEVTIVMTRVVPDSVFQAIELPELKKNPNVTLVFR
jgi:hypothetical protein